MTLMCNPLDTPSMPYLLGATEENKKNSLKPPKMSLNRVFTPRLLLLRRKAALSLARSTPLRTTGLRRSISISSCRRWRHHRPSKRERMSLPQPLPPRLLRSPIP